MTDRLAITGLDVGQARDYAAMTTLMLLPGGQWMATRPRRAELGTSYDGQAAWLARRLDRLADAGTTPVGAVDATGVGRSVLETARAVSVHPVMSVTATGGRQAHYQRGRITCPQRGMIGLLSDAVSTGRLVFDTDTGPLTAELGQLRRRGGRVDAARGHDDLAMSLAVAFTTAEFARNPDGAERRVRMHTKGVA